MNSIDIESIFNEWEPLLIKQILKLSLDEIEYSEPQVHLSSSFGIQFCFQEYSHENMKFGVDSPGKLYTGSPTIHLKEVTLLEASEYERMYQKYFECQKYYDSGKNNNEFFRSIFDWFILVWDKTIQYDYVKSSYRNSSDFNKLGKEPIPGLNCTALKIDLMCVEYGWYFDLINKIEY